MSHHQLNCLNFALDRILGSADHLIPFPAERRAERTGRRADAGCGHRYAAGIGRGRATRGRGGAAEEAGQSSRTVGRGVVGRVGRQPRRLKRASAASSRHGICKRHVTAAAEPRIQPLLIDQRGVGRDLHRGGRAGRGRVLTGGTAPAIRQRLRPRTGQILEQAAG